MKMNMNTNQWTFFFFSLLLWPRCVFLCIKSIIHVSLNHLSQLWQTFLVSLSFFWKKSPDIPIKCSAKKSNIKSKLWTTLYCDSMRVNCTIITTICQCWFENNLIGEMNEFGDWHENIGPIFFSNPQLFCYF